VWAKAEQQAVAAEQQQLQESRRFREVVEEEWVV
jgi:hypothetical protein